MSALDEMRKRVKQNKSILDNAETKTSNTLNEMRQRVEAKKQEIEAQNKKVQEYNDFLKTTDTSKIKPLQLPQDKLLSRERVAELAKKQTDAQREIDYYTKNPATFGSNLKRNLLEPTKQTLKNFSTAALSAGANTIEYFQDNNAVTAWNDEKKAMMKALNEQFSLPKGERTLNIKKTDTYNKTLEEEAQKRYEDTDALTQRLRDMRAKTIQETQNMEKGLGKSIAESSIVVGDMLPAIGVGVLTGGVGSSLAIYGNAAQNAYQTAIENGATHEQASNNATLNGLLEATIELIGGKALGKLTKLPTLSSKVGGKILAKMPNGIKTALNNTFIRGGLGIASDVLEEGFEEVVSGFMQPFIDRVTYNPDAPLASLESQWEAFSSSILPTLMFAGINIGSNRVIASLDKQMAVKSVNAQIDNLANKQIQQIENTDLPMLERVEMINEVKKQQVETKIKFAEEINKFEVLETPPDTNLKTTPQNNTNFAKTTPINEDISQKNVQNVSNLKNTYENQKMVEKHIVDNIEATTLVAGKKSTTRQKKKQIVEEFLNREYPNNKIDFQINYDTGNVRVTNIYNKQELEEYGETLQKQRQNQIEEYTRKHPDTIQQDEIDLRYNELPDDKQLRDMFEINDKIDELVENLNKKVYEIGVEHSKASADASYINVETNTGTKQIRIANHYKSGVSGNADVNINMSEYGSKKVLLEDIEKAITDALNLQKTVQNNSTIQGLEDYTEQDIKDLVSDYVEDITNEKVNDIVLVNEDGNIKAKVYYNGNLNEIEPLEVEGKKIKIEQQMYEESDVFEERASYNVDINEENEYNTRKREVTRKPEARNYTYKKIESRDRARVNSDYMANEIKYADDVGVVNFDDVSYAYEKTNEGINVLLKFKGSQNYIKGVTEYVRGSSNTRPKGYNRYVEIARSRYADNNISDADGGRTRTSEESNIETDRTRRQGRKDDIAENVKNNGNNLENSEEQGSFSMELTPEEKLEKYEEEREESLRRIAKKAGMGYSYLDANKGETQHEMFWLLRHSETLREQFIQENNINLEGKTSSEKYDLIDGNPEFEKFINKITDEYFKGNRPELTDEEVMEIAQDIHGTTDDYSVGAYMTIDGELLDFDDGGYRDDHRTIGVPTYTMVDFMNAGNIRMQPEGSGFEVIVEPTDAQYERLADYIDNYLDGEVYVDVSNEKGVSIAGKNYPQGTSSEKILNDLSEYFRTGKFRKRSELDDFREPRAEYEAQMKLNMDVTTETIESAKNYNGGLKPIVIGHRIWEGYKKQGYIDLNNTKVSTAQDMAEIAQIFRNPYYETFRVIYTKGKGRDRVIVGQEALTSFLPSSVNLINKENTLAKYTYKMKNRMKRLEADGYYLLHNHPSGNAKASKADIKLTETIANLVPGFNDHIIVDHGTYAYIYITQPGLISGGEGVAVDNIPISTVDSSYGAGVYTEEKLNEYLDKTISNRTEIVKLASNFRHDKDYSTLILADSGLKLNAVIDVPNSIFDNHKQIENYIRNISKKYGATNAFIATQNDDTYRNLIKNVQNVRDIILYRANGESFVKATQGSEVFLREAVQREKRSLGISEETKEERIERVRKYVEETQKSIGTLGANVSRKDIITRIIDNYGITAKGNSKELDRVSKEIQELIKKGGFTDNKIEGYAEQLIENLKVTTDDYYNANKELKELIRRTKLYASDSVKAGFADWADFKKSNVGTIRATNDVDALPVDTFYQELSEMYGETFFPSDVINPSDQLQKIAEVAKQIKVIDMTLKQNLEENFGEEAIKEIINGLVENFKTLREQMAEEVSQQSDVIETTEIKTRRWSQTVRKNDMVQTFLDKDLQDYKYVVRSNKATIAKANETLMRKGYDGSIHYFDSVVESGKFPTVDDIALGERLIQESIKRGEFEKATEIIADVTILGTELGQAVQAMSMISRLSPAGQLMYLQRAVKRINNKYDTQSIKKSSKINKARKEKQITEGLQTRIKNGEIDNSRLVNMFTEIVSGKQSEFELPREINDNTTLKNMIDKIVLGEQTKVKLTEETKDNSKLYELISEIVTGEQSKFELPKEIRDNSKLMELVTQIVEGEQTKLELIKKMEYDSKLNEIITNVVEGEQEKLDLGSLDESFESIKEFKKGKIEITPEMEREILSAKTPEELEIAVTRVKEQIAAQLPVEASEKLSEWRYLAMLGNPKTHIRNTVGNLMMTAPYEMKNLYQRIIETTFDSKLDERTKTFKKATDVVKAFAEDMVEQNKDTLTGNGYTNIQSELKNMRKIYKSKILETLKQANMKALDFEDFVFKKRAFKSTLVEYLTANGIRTEKDIQENPELIQKGINFAIEEAKKATFNQYNSVATAISRFESDKTIGKILVGGLAPFKRTPLNIVKTAWQYSPAGLAETLTFRTIDLKNGLITANDYIERISQGLTGVSITAIGFLLASMGVLTGSMGSKKKDKYEQSIGLRVPYSIKAGDRYIDISWLSPSAIPLLIGAELYSLADDGESGLSIDGIVKVVEKMMNPISEMTMLSTFNDALINYAGDDDISGLAGILDTVVKSYIGQAFPTLGNQINKIIDPTVRTTKVSKNSKFKTGEQIVRTNMNKIVGLSYLLEPSTDVWGNVQKRSDNVVLRSLDALVNPASVVENKSTSVDKEIMKLYEINQNDDIIPKIPNNYFTLNGYKYEFSAEEYTDFKITYGQTAYKELQKLFRTTEYKDMTTEDKEKAIKEVYNLAQQKAREEYRITPNALIKEYGEKEAANRLFDNKQLPKYEMAKKNIGLSLKQYYEAYNAQKGVTGKKDAKGKIISGTEKNNRINAMEKTGLTRTQATQMYKILEGTL